MENKQKIKISIFLEAIILVVLLILSLNIFISLNKNNNLYVEVLPLQTQKSEINKKIQQISEEYNISIIYGNETFDIAENVNAIPVMNDEKIKLQLEAIKKSLEKYDVGFFKEDSLTIILLDYFQNDNLALASRNNLGEYKIYLSYNENLERSIHHEIYHIFEYMNNINDSNEYINWNNLNPKNFEYNQDIKYLTNQYVYGSSYDNDDIYFVTRYSKTSPKEDRAEVFAEMMIKKYDFKNINNITAKIKTIYNVLQKYGNNVN